MKLKPKITLSDHFIELTDPRIDRTKEHLLIDIVTIGICGVICPKGRCTLVVYRFAYGADTWVGIETYGKAQKKWLKQFLALPNGIPYHDTFARVFARLNTEEFQALLSQLG